MSGRWDTKSSTQWLSTSIATTTNVVRPPTMTWQSATPSEWEQGDQGGQGGQGDPTAPQGLGLGDVGAQGLGMNAAAAPFAGVPAWADRQELLGQLSEAGLLDESDE